MTPVFHCEQLMGQKRPSPGAGLSSTGRLRGSAGQFIVLRFTASVFGLALVHSLCRPIPKILVHPHVVMLVEPLGMTEVMGK